MNSNCLIFVFLLWWRGRKRRAKYRQKGKKRRFYIAMRKSDSGNFPHFLWFEQGHIISYKPLSPIDRKCPPALFKGCVRWGDIPK